jgi:hypothetical protein
MADRRFVRSNRGGPLVISAAGVHFAMLDGQSLLHFTVTRGALCWFEGSTLALHEVENAFLKHRKEIEHIAERKYRAGGSPTERTTVSVRDCEGGKPLVGPAQN